MIALSNVEIWLYKSMLYSFFRVKFGGFGATKESIFTLDTFLHYKGNQCINSLGHDQFQGQPQIYLPTSQSYHTKH